MNKLVKLVVLGFIVVGISACGKTGELTPTKAETVPVKVKKAEAVSVTLPKAEKVNATLPKAEPNASYCFSGDCSAPVETDIMPHSSK